jgi:hypothetical protein
MDREEFIQKLGRSSILAVFEAASKMFDEDYEEEEILDAREAYQEDLSFGSEDPYETWEGMPMCEGFDAFEEDPEDFTEGREIGIPRNQLIVSSPMQGMLKPNPILALFQVREEDY